MSQKKSFQGLILTLQEFWAAQGCVILQPYDMEVGAGTFHPATTLRALGPKPWRAAYVQPSRRPKDGRYGENPNRLQHYYQFQVILKPNPPNLQELYLASLKAIGVDLTLHDIRFVEDDWESPTLGAWGLGWGVLVRRDGGVAVHLFPAGRGLRVRARVGRADLWPRAAGDVRAGDRERLRPRTSTDAEGSRARLHGDVLGDVFRQAEQEYSRHNFEYADTDHAVPAFQGIAEAEWRDGYLDASGSRRPRRRTSRGT